MNLRRGAETIARDIFKPDASLPRRDVAAVAAAVPVLTLLAVWRAAPALATRTIWAEDGREFLADAVNHGVFGSVLRTYNGYEHVAPRLVAALASARLPDAALVLSGGACLIVACLAGFVYFAARPHVPARALRAALAGSVVLLPIAAAETLGNAANLHWFLIYAAFWAVLWVPQGWPMRITSAVVLFLALASDPFPLVLAPLATLRLVLLLPRRDRLTAPIAFGAGAAVQLGGMLLSTRPKPPPSYMGAAKLYPLRVILTTATGFDFPSHLFTRFGWVVVTAAVVAATLALATLAVLGDRRRLVLPALALALSVAMFVLYAGIRWTDGLSPVRGEPAFHTDARYSVTPSLLLLSAVALLVTHVRARTVRIYATGAFVVIVAWTSLIDFRVPTTRAAHPTWSESVADAARLCNNSATRVLVEVQPVSRPVPWGVDLSCAAIRGASRGR